MKTTYRWQASLSLLASTLLFAGGITNESNAQCVPVISMNQTKNLRGTWSNGITEIGIQANTGSQVRIICSIELFMRARFVNETMKVSIYDAKGKWGSGKQLGASTMTVSTTNQVCRAYFSPPVVIPKNMGFWIVYNQANRVIWPVERTGTTVTHYRYLNSVWKAVTSLAWNYRISTGKATRGAFTTYGSGCPGTKSPVLSNTGRPILGKSFSVDLSNARPSSPVIFLLGFSNTRWAQVIPLPLNLEGLGAPNCFLHTSTQLMLGTVTDLNGKATLSLPIPNNPKLVGAFFYNQFFVYDPAANAFGMVVSNGGKATIGTF